jgi:hypothetical protein
MDSRQMRVSLLEILRDWRSSVSVDHVFPKGWSLTGGYVTERTVSFYGPLECPLMTSHSICVMRGLPIRPLFLWACCLQLKF